MNPDNVNCAQTNSSVCKKSDRIPNANENFKLCSSQNHNKNCSKLASVVKNKVNVWNVFRNLIRNIRNITKRLKQRAKKEEVKLQETFKNSVLSNEDQSKQASTSNNKINIKTLFRNLIRNKRASKKANEETLKSEKDDFEKIPENIDSIGKENCLKINPENSNSAQKNNTDINKLDISPHANEVNELSPTDKKETDKNLLVHNKDQLKQAFVPNIMNRLRNLLIHIRTIIRNAKEKRKAKKGTLELEKTDENLVLRSEDHSKQALISKIKISIKNFFHTLRQNRSVKNSNEKILKTDTENLEKIPEKFDSLCKEHSLKIKTDSSNSAQANNTNIKKLDGSNEKDDLLSTDNKKVMDKNLVVVNKDEKILKNEKENLEIIPNKFDSLCKENCLKIKTDNSNCAQANNNNINKIDGSNEKDDLLSTDNKKETNKNLVIDNKDKSKQVSVPKNKMNITNMLRNLLIHLRTILKNAKEKPKSKKLELKLEETDKNVVLSNEDPSKQASIPENKINIKNLNDAQANNTDMNKIEGSPNAKGKNELPPTENKNEIDKNLVFSNKGPSKQSSIPKSKINIKKFFRHLITRKRTSKKANEETLKTENLNSAQTNNTDIKKIDGNPDDSVKNELSPTDNKKEIDNNLLTDNKDKSKQASIPKDKTNIINKFRNMLIHIRNIIKKSEEERKAKKEAYKLEKEKLKTIPKILDKSHKEKRYSAEREWFIDQYQKYVVCMPRPIDRTNPKFVLGWLRLKSLLRFVPEQNKPPCIWRKGPPSSVYLAWKGPTIPNCRCPFRECFCRGDVNLGKKKIPCEKRFESGMGYLSPTSFRRKHTSFIERLQKKLNNETERYKKLYEGGTLKKMAPEQCLLRCQHRNNPGKYRTIKFLPLEALSHDRRWDDDVEEPEQEEKKDKEEDEDFTKICGVVSCTVGIQVNIENDGDIKVGKSSRFLYPSMKESFLPNLEGQKLQISTYEREVPVCDNLERIRTMEKLWSLDEIKCRVSKLISSIFVIKDPGIPVTTRSTQLPCCRNACKDTKRRRTSEYSCGDKYYNSIPEVPWSDRIDESTIKDIIKNENVDDKDQGTCVCCKLYKEQFNIDVEEDVPEKLKNEILRDIIPDSYLENNQEIPQKETQNSKDVEEFKDEVIVELHHNKVHYY